MKTKFFTGLFLGLNIVVAAFLLTTAVSSTTAPEAAEQVAEQPQSEGILGEVKLFAGTFAPRGWADCSGQLLPISQNSALFSLLGTTYGGDGRTTFALPDLRGRAPIHLGTGPGLPDYRLGQKGGSANLPTVGVASGKGTNVVRGPSVMPPYQVVRYIICVSGTYPSRS